MKYVLIQFTKGLECLAYQEIDAGICIRNLDMDGNELTLPLDGAESHVVDNDPPFPSWGVQ